jgi:hypothetical protein
MIDAVVEARTPQLSVTFVGAAPASATDHDVAWQITNDGRDAVEILESWLPHGQFYADREPCSPASRLEPGAGVRIGRRVRCGGEGDEVENAFLILQLRSGGAAWRLFTRLRVIKEAGGAARPVVEAVTLQPVGFAVREAEAGPTKT